MDLLRQLQLETDGHALRSGGWPIENGQRAGIETTCYALMALGGDHASTRLKAIDVLLRTQNSDGSWPAFEGDDPEGCWTTAIAAITLRFAQSPIGPIEKALGWLLENNGREDHWLWKWKFRTVDRAVQLIRTSTDGPGFPAL